MNNFVLNSWIRSAIPGLFRLHKLWYESNKCTWAYPLQVLIHIMATTIPPRTHPHLPPLAHISSQFCQAPFILLEFSSVAKLKVHKKWKNELTCLSSFPCLCHSKLAGRQLESRILNLWYLKKPALWLCAFRHALYKVCKDQWKLLLYWETPPSFSELNINSLHRLLHISSNFSSDNLCIFFFPLISNMQNIL